MCGLFLQVKFATSLLALLAGGLWKIRIQIAYSGIQWRSEYQNQLNTRLLLLLYSSGKIHSIGFDHRDTGPVLKCRKISKHLKTELVSTIQKGTGPEVVKLFDFFLFFDHLPCSFRGCPLLSTLLGLTYSVRVTALLVEGHLATALNIFLMLKTSLEKSCVSTLGPDF